jgi:hypothetical protein
MSDGWLLQYRLTMKNPIGLAGLMGFCFFLKIETADGGRELSYWTGRKNHQQVSAPMILVPLLWRKMF